MNLDLQVHIENITEDGGMNTYTGIAWSRGAAMEKIEYSTDGGETWTEVMYESVNGTLSSYQSFEFQFKVNTNSLPSGYNMVIVRGVDTEGSPSMIDWDTVIGGGDLSTLGSGDSLGRTLFIATVGIAIIAFGAFVAIRQSGDEPLQLAVMSEKSEQIPDVVDDEPIEAEIIDDSLSDGSS